MGSPASPPRPTTKQLTQMATAIDRYAYDEALSLFLCAPRACTR
jgi:hypothetical protein